MKSYVLSLIVIGTLVFSISCTPRSRYERQMKKGIESGIRHDSLFLGIYLGMPEKDFYTHCWNLNKKGLLKQGTGNTSVEHILEKGLLHPAIMNFYPSFVDGKVAEMPVQFKYQGWSPWNKEMSADALQQDVIRWCTSIYGDGFIKVRHRERGTAMVKIDGNRRISVFKTDEMMVWAIFTDLSVLKPEKNEPVRKEGSDTTTTK